MRRLIPLALGLAAVFLAGCGTAGAGAGSSSAPHESPLPAAPASWQLGGAYTGPVPPAPGLPDPAGGIRFKPETDERGYTTQTTVRFGAPLHLDIPQVLVDCYTAYPNQRLDLDPGQYVIPFQIITTNKTNQKAPASEIDVTASSSPGNDGTSIQTTQSPHQTWADGSCQMDYGQNMHVGGQAVASGYIGPATAKELANAWISIGIKGTYPWNLTTLEPHKTASWLISHS